MYAVLVTFVRHIVLFYLTVHDGVIPLRGGDHVEVDPGNNECNEDCEERDVKLEEVYDVAHLSSGVKVCDYVYNLTGI